MDRQSPIDGASFDGVLEDLGWFGKRFTPDMRADVLLFRAGDRRLVAVDPKWIPLRLTLRFYKIDRTRVASNQVFLSPAPAAGEGPVASLKAMMFGCVKSAAMVYDDQPIVDHFRRIDAERIMGAKFRSAQVRHEPSRRQFLMSSSKGHIMLKYKLYVLVVKADGNLAILAALAMVLTAIWRGVLPIGSFY
ncbi:DUF4334 domain-containing protein [Rhizobium sp. MC63]|jgi:hypothetical protein|uniref:DUF4334 domain-containing protein n=8 Tax=Rhizobium TaxID=379 RepID=A0A1C3Y9S5_9HYPH|nr:MULTISPECIES: DUF4334 domain-containing protein [Rhizobium]ACE93815.1 hypothetical conserved protein [Rhizobium etli CIAT 652]MBB4436536.1 hypothetical protein [Rhizobium esperanzae]PDT25985.1 hypothetical protein CO660_30345 [Rhizobium sp. L9]UWU38884.1 DUF4334 domain-containing protein [Rhizobium leguminosarum bv. phaseoli]AAM54980.1 hypothetical conserved protein [Rhizobium etli CFN 42]